MLVCAGASLCVSVCVYALRKVFTDKILRFRNVLIIIMIINTHRCFKVSASVKARPVLRETPRDFAISI